MAENSKIEWTHHTFNPWVGCTKVSEACRNCYAEAWAKRSGIVKWGENAERRRTSESYWREPTKWNREALISGERRRVFCASLADVFEDRPELTQWRKDLFALIRVTPQLDWLLLTKRPQNILRMMGECFPRGSDRYVRNYLWLGTTVESQSEVRRIDYLVNCRAWAERETENDAIDLLEQCVGADVPFLWKQNGGRTPKAGGRLLDGKEWNQYPEAKAMSA